MSVPSDKYDQYNSFKSSMAYASVNRPQAYNRKVRNSPVQSEDRPHQAE